MFKSREVLLKKRMKTHKARRVVIFHCLGIAKRFKDGVGLQELPFQFPLWRKTGRTNCVENLFKSWRYASESFINSFLKHAFIWLLQNILKQAMQNQFITTADKKKSHVILLRHFSDSEQFITALLTFS